MKAYPEHEKLKNIQEQSQWLGEFIDWLNEENMFLAKHTEDDIEYPKIIPANISINNLLAKYFKIDLVKIEKEKRQMIEDCRKLNAKQ